MQQKGEENLINVLYFAQVGWSWIKQRPHFLPEALSKLNCKVTFFALAIGQHIPTSCSKDNFKIVEIKGIRGNAKYLLSRLINKALCYGEFNKSWTDNIDVIVLTYPFQYDFLPDKLKDKPIIYDCMDNIPLFYRGKTKKKMQSKEKNLCENARHIIASSICLAETIKDKYQIEDKKISIIRNALSEEILLEKIEQREINKIFHLVHPNTVYVGTVGEWIDYDLIFQFARDNSDITIYMVGPIAKNVQELMGKAPANIIFKGQRQHAEAMEYIKNADLVLLPFKVNDLIRCVDPVKLYEYIALGKKVISAHWDELDYFKSENNIYFYKDQDSFETLMRKGLTQENLEEDKRKFIETNTWMVRAKHLYKIICQCVEDK